MGSIKWTQEQSDAIYTRNCNLLVAAAAGSGKTAVLVQRIIEMITNRDNPTDIDRLLIVTFTNAAASEMRERIGAAISKAINESQREGQLDGVKNLQRQLTLLNRASITTIHSFCLNTIKNNFHMLDLDPGFRVCDQTEIELIKREAIEAVFEREYELLDRGENNNFKLLMDAYCSNRDDEGLKSLVLEIYRKIMSLPRPFKWIEEKCEDFNIKEGETLEGTIWSNALLEDMRLEIRGELLKISEAISIIEGVDELLPYLDNYKEDYEYIKKASDSIEEGIESFGVALEAVKFGKLKTVRNIKDKVTKDRAKDIRDGVKKKIEAMKETMSTYMASNSVEDIRYMYGVMSELRRVIFEFRDEFKKSKGDRGLIDFNDFEHYALKLLVEHDEDDEVVMKDGWFIPSETAKEIREKFDEILVDEYQDSNMVQEVILNMISREALGEPNVFMVGDVKQSIYKFRQANPKLFMDKYERYSEIKGDNYRKILLFKNFRSRENVVNSINYIFEMIMSKDAGELLYDWRERLNFGAFFKETDGVEGTIGGDTELDIINLEDSGIGSEGEENEGEDLSKLEIEAKFIASRIKKLMKEEDFKVYDKNIGEYRSLQFRDIVILLRSTSTTAEIIMEELKKNEIPVYADMGNGYFEATEVKVILSLLKIIDNPLQDIHFIAALRSPVGGFTPEEFVKIRKANVGDTFFDACILYAEGKSNVEEENIEFDQGLQRRLGEFIERLKRWREESKYTALDQFIWNLITETGYYGFVGAQSNGLLRQGNLKILYQRAKSFEKTSFKGLFNFMSFMEKLKKSNGDLGAAKTIGESEDVVRIMSIHKSKGLEFPVVFVSTMSKQFNMMDMNGSILFHDEMGFGPDYINLDLRMSYPTIFKEIIKSKMKKETISEEMRILYVALTRAKEKLILTATSKDIPKYLKSISKKIVFEGDKILSASIMSGKCYLDWVVSALMLHKSGRVLREECDFLATEDFEKFNYECGWDINLIDGARFRVQEEEEKDEEELLSKKIKDELKRETSGKYSDTVDKRLSFEYEFKEAIALPTVTTVTQLKKNEGIFKENVDENRERKTPTLKNRPQFLEGKIGLNAAEKGTAMHNVMQYIKFSEEMSIENIEDQINEMVHGEFITEEEGRCINKGKIIRFLNSNIGKQTIEAYKEKRLFREHAFGINIAAYEALPHYGDLEYGGKYNDETIKLQGIIDMYIEEEDGIILLDFKTDYCTKDNKNEIVDRYRRQLEIYSMAIERITGKDVKKKILYLFSIDEDVAI